MTVPPGATIAAPLSRCADVLARLRGWRRYGTAALLGGFATTALPPLHLLPALLVAFPGLIWIVDGSRSRRAAFAAGWWFGFGYFLVGLYWVSNALLTDPGRFGWLLPFSVVGLPIVLAPFTGLAALVYRMAGTTGWRGVLAFAVSWVALEWLRGHVLTGFPWNLTGYVWTISDAMLQVTAFIGIYGLSLITVAAAALPATLVGTRQGGSGLRWRPMLVGLLLLAVLWGGGAARLAGAGDDVVDDVRLRIVQANIPQHLKWRVENRVTHFRKYLDLSKGVGPGDITASNITHVIWPETATAFFLGEQIEARAAMARITPRGGLILTGAPRVRRDDDSRLRQVWNSMHALDDTGALVGTYDKFHLVPFGEYVPFRDVVNITKLTAGGIDFTPGPGPQTLDLAGLPPVSPLICYEAIFPGEVSDPGNRPRWLLNLTNDAWYGRSAGPYQHLATARVRAVEEGLPLVRAANTGISAVVDAYGRITHQLGLGQTGVIDASLPKALAAPTVYGRFGDLTLLPLILCGALLAWVGRVV